MMSLAQLRKKYSAATPSEVLESLVAIYKDPQVPEDYRPPILTVVMASGNTFRGYIVGAKASQESGPTFVFSLEIQNQGDGAADLIYVQGRHIESLTVWNVDDYPGTLPRHTSGKPR